MGPDYWSLYVWCIWFLMKTRTHCPSTPSYLWILSVGCFLLTFLPPLRNLDRILTFTIFISRFEENKFLSWERCKSFLSFFRVPIQDVLFFVCWKHVFWPRRRMKEKIKSASHSDREIANLRNGLKDAVEHSEHFISTYCSCFWPRLLLYL